VGGRENARPLVFSTSGGHLPAPLSVLADQILANRFHALAEEFMAKAAHTDIEDESECFPFAHIVQNEQED